MDFFNSKECEWADMKVTIAGARVIKIRGIKYKPTADKELLYAEGNMPFDIQDGNRGFEGEIKVLKGAVDDMNDAAIAAGARNVLDLEFPVIISYKAKGVRRLRTMTLVNVQVKEFEYGWDQGAKFMEITLPILFTDVLPG